MRRRTKIILVLGTLVLFALGLVVFKPEKEPEYQGKKLSEWVLQGYSGWGAIPIEPGRAAEAKTAIIKIGTNAFPLLLNWYNYRQPKWRTQLSNLLDSIMEYVGISWRLSNDRKEKLSWATENVFRNLGAGAEPAIPTIAHSLLQPRDEFDPLRAANTLVWLGPKGSDPLITGVTNSRADVRSACVGAIFWQASTNSPVPHIIALPGLVACMQHPDAITAQHAAKNIGYLRCAPEIITPVLIKAAAGNRQAVCQGAIEALGNIGPDASNAIPVLLKALNSTNRLTRDLATNAIRQIDPYALPK